MKFLSSVRPLLAAAALGAVACADGGTQPDNLRFGQIGEVRLQLVQPRFHEARAQGELRQSLTWNSSGPWQITEEITYGGGGGDRAPGDQTTRRSAMNPEVLAGEYAQWIHAVNDGVPPALKLFGELDPTLEPECRADRSRLTLLIRDDPRDEEIAWTRCVDGNLSTITTRDAGPDLPAARLAAAVIEFKARAHDPFVSSYHGSVPFATLDRGESSPAALEGPRVILDQQAWKQFWTEHKGAGSAAPHVDFGSEIVLVAGVGVRHEAGDSVEVRRILSVGDSTKVEYVEVIPGDFCSPAQRTQRPFHVVVAPSVPRPVQFIELRKERVPCGA